MSEPDKSLHRMLLRKNLLARVVAFGVLAPATIYLSQSAESAPVPWSPLLCLFWGFCLLVSVPLWFPGFRERWHAGAEAVFVDLESVVAGVWAMTFGYDIVALWGILAAAVFNRVALQGLLGFGRSVVAVAVGVALGALWLKPPMVLTLRTDIAVVVLPLFLVFLLVAESQRRGLVTELVEAQSTLEARARHLQETVETLHRTQAQLVQRQKMAALGDLVAGIAHEVNTPLGVAITASSIAEEQLQSARRMMDDGGQPSRAIATQLECADEAFAILSQNLARAAKLVQSFKQVAVDRNQLQRRPLELNRWMTAVIKSLSPMARRYGVEVQVIKSVDLHVQLSAGQLEQVVSNLVVNSLKHAFRHVSEGIAGSSERQVVVEVEDTGSSIVLTVQDNGRGMTAAIASRVFEPFFTTGAGDQGTGLGLHIVQQVVTEAFDGQIALATELEEGATWRVELPFGSEGLRRGDSGTLRAGRE